jgi:uncharacterized phage protein gp47/JayE
MPFSRPTLAQIRKRTKSDFDFETGAQAAGVGGTPERGFVEATAGVSHGLHGRLAVVHKNAFVDTMEDDRLIKFAAFFGVTAISATRATGVIYVFAVNGTVIPAGAILTRVDGTQYEVLEETEPALGGKANANCRALLGGEAGNAEVGTELTLSTGGIVGTLGTAEVGSSGMTGGTDEETNLALRIRLKERLANPPNGGGPGSYVRWAKLVAGVTRVWEYGKIDSNGDPKLGWVTVLFVRDGEADIFPGVDEVAAVRAKILEYAPLHLAGLHVQAPINKALLLELEITPNTEAMKEKCITAVQTMLGERATPPDADGALFYKSNIHDALAAVEGLEDYKVTVPAGDVTVDQFELLTLDPGDVTFIP